MRFTLLSCFCLLLETQITQSIVLWSDPLNGTNSESITWTIGANPSGSILFPPSVTVSNCANQQYCWELKEDYFVYYLHSTVHYENISLSVSISAQGLDSPGTSDYCEVLVSINTNTTWRYIARYGPETIFPIHATYPLPSIIANKKAIGIKLQSSNGGGNTNDFCYFSDIKMEGAKMNVNESVWMSSASCLPRMDHGMAVGVYNRSMFLLGGELYRRQITEYQIDTDTLIDIGEIVLPNDVNGQPQYWTQKDEILYVLTWGNPVSTISTYNMKNKVYTANWVNISFNLNAFFTSSCVASSDQQLFVLGGYHAQPSYMTTLQVMDFDSNQWLNNTPPMKERRRYHGCIVYYSYLWAFAGSNSFLLKSNERIKLADIVPDWTVNQWRYIASLSVSIKGIKAVGLSQNIFVIGGITSGAYPQCQNIVHVFDVVTGDVVVSEDTLVYSVVFTGTSLIDGMIYAFGGTSQVDFGDGTVEFNTNTWMKYEPFPSKTPTTTTMLTSTNVPSESPVILTTNVPSESPVVLTTTNVILTTTNVSSESPVILTTTNVPSDSPVTLTSTNMPSESPVILTSTTPLLKSTEIDISMQSTGSVIITITTNYTISIHISGIINETEISNIILTAFMDPNAAILITEVMHHNIVIKLSVETDPQHMLQIDYIESTIEKELEENYAEVDIDITTSDGNNDNTEPPKDIEKQSKSQYIIFIVVGTAVFCCTILCLCVIKLFEYWKQKHMKDITTQLHISSITVGKTQSENKTENNEDASETENIEDMFEDKNAIKATTAHTSGEQVLVEEKPEGEEGSESGSIDSMYNNDGEEMETKGNMTHRGSVELDTKGFKHTDGNTD